MLVKRHLPAIAGLAALSFFAGNFPGPADPISSIFFACIIFPVAVISYFVGVLVSRPHTGNPIRENLTLLIAAALCLASSIAFATVEFDRVVAAQPALPDDPVKAMNEALDAMREASDRD